MAGIKKILIMITITALIASGCISGPAEQSSDGIVSKMVQNYENIKDYKGTMIMKTYLEGGTRSMQADFMYKMPDKFKFTNKEAGMLTGNIKMSDGHTLWDYNSKSNDVRITEINEGKLQLEGDYGKFIKGLQKENDIEYLGPENSNGKTYYVLKVTPRTQSGGTFNLIQKVWVDKDTWMLWRIETSNEKGIVLISLEYRNIQVNSGIPDSEFEFVMPQGAKEVKADYIKPEETTISGAKEKAGFKVYEPAYLPAGFIAESAAVSSDKGVKKVTMTYNAGHKNIMITESNPAGEKYGDLDFKDVRIGSIDGRYVDTGYGNILVWNIGDTQIVLSSPLGMEEIIKIAESMK